MVLGVNPSFVLSPPLLPWCPYSLYHPFVQLRGCLHVKTRTGASLIPAWHSDFIPCLHEGTLHVDQRDCDANLNWISKTAHALPVPDSRENDFMLERMPVPRLHDIGMCFRTGMKISLRYSYQGELAPVWLAPLWDFVLVSCKRIQSHKRKLEWTRTGMKVAPVSCKHLLRLNTYNGWIPGVTRLRHIHLYQNYNFLKLVPK